MLMNAGEMISRRLEGERHRLEREVELEVLAGREAAARAEAEDQTRSAKALEALDRNVKLASVAEKKFYEQYAEAQARTATAARERMQATVTRANRRRAYERDMRATAPKDLLDGFVRRVDGLIDAAIEPYDHAVDHSTVPQRQILLRGDATARRRALFGLKQEIANSWYLEPLSASQFEAKFAAAVGALPAIQPPPSLATYLGPRSAA